MSVAYLAYRVKNRSLYPPGWRRLEKETLRSHPFCSFCGAPKPLQVHHINPVHLHPEMALDASNLIVLCQPCHLREGHVSNFQKGHDPDIGQRAESNLQAIRVVQRMEGI